MNNIPTISPYAARRPWKIAGYNWVILDAAGEMVCQYAPITGPFNKDTVNANAEAIVACVNACSPGNDAVQQRADSLIKWHPCFHNPDKVGYDDLQKNNEGVNMRFLTTDEHRQLLMTGCWSGMLEVWCINDWTRNNHAGLHGLVCTMRTANPMPNTIEEAVRMGKEYAT